MNMEQVYNLVQEVLPIAITCIMSMCGSIAVIELSEFLVVKAFQLLKI